MNRRSFLKIAGLSAAFMPVVFSSRPVRAADEKHMNLLVIHTDEHNFRTLGCYRAQLPKEQALMWGDAVVETPNIDWIAKNGAICMNFYATTPVCSPSRAAFVSGKYPHNTPVSRNDIPMSDDVVTFAEILKRQGYTTGYAGKWHLDGQGKPEFGPRRKFGFDDNRYMYNRGHWKQLEDAPAGPRVKSKNSSGEPTYSVRGADEKSFTTDFLADKTVDFIRENRDKSFCYMVSFPDPHGPDSVRTPYDTMFSGQKYAMPRTFNVSDDKAPKWGEPHEKFQDMSPYYGMVKCIDDNVGKMLDALRKNGLIEKTIVVFTSDHGDLRGEHHRQNKGVPFEASAKIPFLMYAPSVVKAGTVVNEVLGCVDFLPTVISLMGFKTAGKEEGRDASSLLITGKVPEGWKDIVFFRATGEQGHWLAVAGGGYKLVYSPIDNPWLFDLKKDPDELINCFLDPAYRNIVRDMSGMLLEYGKKFNDANINEPKIKADIEWAINGAGQFQPTPVSAIGGKGRKRKKAGSEEE